ELKPLERQAAQLPLPEHYDLIVFVSSNAARFYIDMLTGRRSGPWPAATRAATVGAPSARYLRDAGGVPASHILHPDAQSDTQDSEGLWGVLEPMLGSFKRVLIVRGMSGREWLGERFDQAGIHVDRLALYDRQAAIWDTRQGDLLAAALAAPGLCIFLLTSGE